MQRNHKYRNLSYSPRLIRARRKRLLVVHCKHYGQKAKEKFFCLDLVDKRITAHVKL